jgi:hypothetical protein
MASKFAGGGPSQPRHRPRRYRMLAFNAFGTKEVVVYVIVVVIVLILIGWYLMRRRTKA